MLLLILTTNSTQRY